MPLFDLYPNFKICPQYLHILHKSKLTLEDSGGGAECDAVSRQLTEGQSDRDPDGGHERKDANVDHVGGDRGPGRHLDGFISFNSILGHIYIILPQIVNLIFLD